MSYPLNNATTTDTYIDKNTVDSIPPCARFNIDVTNQAVFYQLRSPLAGDDPLRPETWNWQPEVRLNPGFKSLDRIFSGYRVRSAIIGSPAVVTIDAITRVEVYGR